MRIAYITAGAAGMFCGSCMHDNTLVADLQRQGHDALLIPTYTPIRTDEADVSQHRVFFGGINVFLQQKVSLFRYTPRFFDRLLDANWLLHWVSRFAASTQAAELGGLTISMLQGEHGHQAKEIDKLVDWLETDVKPDVINLTNVLLSGMVHRLRERLKVPVLGSLQGDDIFLEMLPEAHREQGHRPDPRALRPDGWLHRHEPLLRRLHGRTTYVSRAEDRRRPSRPEPEGARRRSPRRRALAPFTIGYFARICPEKGLHHLVDAFCMLRRRRTCRRAGCTSPAGSAKTTRPISHEQRKKLAASELA